MQFKRAVCGALSLALSVIVINSPAQTYHVTDLGTLGGQSRAYGINTSGAVVGESFINQTSSHAFRWDPASANGTTGSMIDLQLHLPGIFTSSARGINASGQIVGTFKVIGAYNAFRTGPAATSFSSANGLGSNSFGFGINASGQVIGSMTIGNPFRTTAAGDISTADDLGNMGTTGGDGLGINTSGLSVGGSSPINGGERAVKAPMATTFGMASADLTAGGLPGLPNGRSIAKSVNDNGDIVGYMALDNNNTIFKAFRIPAGDFLDTTLHSLGSLGGNSYSLAINNAGIVVGYYGPAGSEQGFVYRSEKMFNLTALLDESGADLTILKANGINDSGQIVGEAIDGSGNSRAVLLSPNQVAIFTLSSISPGRILVGSPDTEITLTGSGFVSGAQAKWRRQLLTTTFVSSNTLKASVPVELLGAIGTFKVIVRNPNGAESNAARVRVLPHLKGLKTNPSNIYGGDSTSGTAILNFPAGTSGVDVSLDTADSHVAVPISSHVSTGLISSNFPISTIPLVLGPNVEALIFGHYQGTNARSKLIVKPPIFKKMLADVHNVVLRHSPVPVFTITLSSPAGPGGISIAITTSDDILLLPTSVLVPAGSSSITVNSVYHATRTITKPVAVTYIASGPGLAGGTNTFSQTVNVKLK